MCLRRLCRGRSGWGLWAGLPRRLSRWGRAPAEGCGRDVRSAVMGPSRAGWDARSRPARPGEAKGQGPGAGRRHPHPAGPTRFLSSEHQLHGSGCRRARPWASGQGHTCPSGQPLGRAQTWQPASRWISSRSQTRNSPSSARRPLPPRPQQRAPEGKALPIQTGCWRGDRGRAAHLTRRLQ